MSGRNSQPRRTTVTTNSFQVTHPPNKTYHHYDVVISKEGGTRTAFPPRRAHEIIAKMQDQHAAVFNPKGVYDGRANFFIARDIGNGSYPVHMGANPDRGQFTVRLQHAAMIDTNVLKRLTQRGGSTPAANTVAVNLLQLIIREGPNRRYGFPPEARSFYIEDGSKPILAHALVAHRGYFQSVRLTMGKILVNVDTSNAVLYSPGSLIDVAMGLLRINSPRDIYNLHTDAAKWRELKQFLKKVLVKVTVPATQGGRDKVRPISDIVPQAGHFAFDKNGVQTLVKDHFSSAHNYRLSHPNAFGVRIGKTAVFPAEVCLIAPGQLYKKKLSPYQQSEFIKFAEQKPQKRLDLIMGAVSHTLGYMGSIPLQEAGMQIDVNPVSVNGEVLNPPMIEYGVPPEVHDRDVMTLNEGAGQWNVKGRRFFMPRNIPFWAVVSFVSDAEQRALEHFIERLAGNLKRLGIKVYGNPQILRSSPQAPIDNVLQSAGDAAIQNGPQDAKIERRPTLIIVALPANAAPIRKAVKYWGDAKCGVATQCIRQGKFDMEQRLLDQYTNNVALKINSKTGGVNSRVVAQDEGMNNFLRIAMIVGADVTHPAPGIFGRPSISSVVASQDEKLSRYSTQLKAQAPRQERIRDLGSMIERALRNYHTYGQQPNQPLKRPLPAHVVFYRDGISEGEYAQVAEGEVSEIKAALASYASRVGQPTPRLLFIVVGKRHHVRFFPMRPQDADRSGNCLSGLVVDNTVTNGQIFQSNYQDFYLQSHSGLKGTSRPSHYVVVCNEGGLTLDQIKQLSFGLCFAYASATRAVSIPAPVYYADRACGRAEFHFDPSIDLEDDSTTASGGHDNFELDRWDRELKQPAQSGKTYFL